MRNMTRSVLRKLWRMKWRAISFSLVVSLATAMLITGLYSAAVFDHSMETYIKDSNFPDIFLKLSGQENVSTVEGPLLSNPVIGSYDMRLRVDAIYSYGGENYPAVIMGVRDPGRSDISKLVLKTGSMFNGPGKGVVITGMEDLGAKEGERLDLRLANRSFNIDVTGTVQTPEFLFTEAVPDSFLPLPAKVLVLYMDQRALEEFAGPGINDIVLLLRKGADRDAVVSSLGDLPISRVTYQEAHSSVAFMEVGSGKMDHMFPMLSVIFMAVGIISIFMTFYRLVMNDSRSIGVMMSLGHSRARIVASYLSMGLVLATMGFIIGILLALFFTWGIMSITMSMFGSVGLAFPADPVPFLIGALFDYGSVMASVGIPVLLITRQTVRESLDHRPKTRIATLSATAPKLSRTALMGLRNTFRNPLRLAFTVLVVGISIGIAGSWVVMSNSALTYINEQVDSDRWDIRADLRSNMPIENVSAILDVHDHDYIIPFMVLAGIVRSGSGMGSAYVVACDRMAEARDFGLYAGRLDLSQAVVTNKLADEVGLKVGNTIRVTVGGRVLETKVSGIVYDIMLRSIFLDRTAASPLIDKGVASGAFIKLKDKGQVPSVTSHLKLVPEVSRVTVQDDISEGIEETFGSSMSLLWSFFVITLIITLVVAASAIIISTMERDVEFATLETLGISRGKVTRSILLEVAIIGIASAGVGIPFAYLFGRVFAAVMEEVIYYFPVLFAMSTIIMTFLFGFMFVMGSALFPIRYARKLDVERTIRERNSG